MTGITFKEVEGFDNTALSMPLIRLDGFSLTQHVSKLALMIRNKNVLKQRNGDF